jgi:transposase
MDKYILNLTADERAALTEVYAKKRVSALRRSRAGILLKADEGLTDAEIAEDLGVGTATVERIRKRAVLEGIDVALERKKQDAPSRKPRLDGRAEAHLVQLACSQPPQGQARWTLTLLGDKLVELNVVESAVSRTTIHRRLKKTASSRGR